MPQQMSLFPSVDVQTDPSAAPQVEGSALNEMFAACGRFRNSIEYLDLLGCIARFPNYSPFNALLLYIQNPNASFVATAGTWRKRFNRRPRATATPLMILAPMSPIRFVFDLEDTEGDPVPPPPAGFSGDRYRLTRETFDNTIHNCTLSGIIIREIKMRPHPEGAPIPITGESLQKDRGMGQDSKMRHLIVLQEDHCLEDKYARLVYELGRIFCGHYGVHADAWWQNRLGEPSGAKEIETESVAYLVCRRRQLTEISETYLSQIRGKDRNIPMVGLHAILNATGFIEDMGKSRWKVPKKAGRYPAE